MPGSRKYPTSFHHCFSFLSLPLVPMLTSAFHRNHHGRLHSTEEFKPFPLMPSSSSSSSFSLLFSLNFSFFFLPHTGNCEPEGKPWSIRFQTLSSSSQKGTKDRGECHIEQAPAAPAGCPGPSGSSEGHQALADSRMARSATVFSVHSEIKSTTFDPSNLFCG